MLVGVKVIVGVSVGVAMLPVVCRMTKTNAAPRPKTRTIKPIAAGRLNFNSGSLGACIGLTGFVLVVVEKLRPHTRHRVAFSLRRVPQVGQTLFCEVVFSGLIFSYLSRGSEERIITSLTNPGFLYLKRMCVILFEYDRNQSVFSYPILLAPVWLL